MPVEFLGAVLQSLRQIRSAMDDKSLMMTKPLCRAILRHVIARK
jgi:hypothetical protein